MNATANHFSFLKPVAAPAAKTPQGKPMLERFKATMDAQIAMAKAEMEGTAPDMKHSYYRKDMARGGYSAKLARKPFKVGESEWFDAGPDLKAVVKFFEQAKTAAEKDEAFVAALEQHNKRQPKAS